MENKEIKPQISNSNPDPKPTEDAQSLVETIIPSTEDSASTTTKEQAAEENSSADAAEDKSDAKAEAETPGGDEKPEQDAGDDADEIETVAP